MYIFLFADSQGADSMYVQRGRFKIKASKWDFCVKNATSQAAFNNEIRVDIYLLYNNIHMFEIISSTLRKHLLILRYS